MATNLTLVSKPEFVAVHRVVGSGFVGRNPSPELSIKCMFGGSARYATDSGQRYRIDDDDYLLLGRGNVYTVEKDPLQAVETFCIFFPPELVKEVAGALRSRPSGVLDEPFGLAPFDAHEHRRPHRGSVSQRVLRLRRHLAQRSLSSEVLEEQLSLLMSEVIREHHSIECYVSNLPWTRPSTRAELFRRVMIGRDFLHAHLTDPFSLESAARAAMLSRFHFLRAFRQITGRTPLRYVNEERLRRAVALLERTRHSITRISAEVGYDSVGAFSAFFAKHKGRSPSAWRRAHSKKQYR